MLLLAYYRWNFSREAFMEIKAKFWIENKGEVVLGGGKAALFLAVDRLGSIQRAADPGGIVGRTHDNEIIVHQIDSFCAKTLLNKFFFKRLCVDQYEIHISLSSDI